MLSSRLYKSAAENVSPSNQAYAHLTIDKDIYAPSPALLNCTIAKSVNLSIINTMGLVNDFIIFYINTYCLFGFVKWHMFINFISNGVGYITDVFIFIQDFLYHKLYKIWR